MSKAEFGRRICTSRQNVSLILRKQSISTIQLMQISRVLDCNFFDYLSPESETKGVPRPTMFMMVGLPDDPNERTRIVESIKSIV